MKSSYRFEFHACFDSPYGNDVVGFDIYFSWKCDAVFNTVPERERGGTRFNELVLKAESDLVLEDQENDALDFAPLFPLRHSLDETKIILGRRRGRGRFGIRGHGSGGNWYWKTYLISAKAQPHLLNWLRRQPGFSLSEWSCEFRDEMWDRRGSIQPAHLRDFARAYIRSFVRMHREAEVKAVQTILA